MARYGCLTAANDGHMLAVMTFFLVFALARGAPRLNALPAVPQQLAHKEYASVQQKLRKAALGSPHETALWLSPRVAARDSHNAAADPADALLLLRAGKFPEASGALTTLKGNDHAHAVAVVMAYLKGRSLPGRQTGSAAPVRYLLPSLPDELGLAKALIGSKDPDLAQIVLEEAASSFPNSSDAHGELGLLLSSQSEYQKAAPELERAVQIEPNSFKYSLALAEAMLSSKHNFTALRFLQSVQNRFQSLPEYQYILALAYYDCYRYPEAISEFEAVAKAQPEMDRVPFLIGNCYMALGDLQKAEEFYQKAIAMKPQQPSYRVALGKMLRMQGRIDEAIHVLEEELQIAPSDAESRYHLALCYEARKNFEEAQLLLERVVRQKPDMLAAHIALARVYYHLAKKENGDRETKIISRLRANQQAGHSETETRPPLESVVPQNQR